MVQRVLGVGDPTGDEKSARGVGALHCGANMSWTPDSWKTRPIAQDVPYDDPAQLEQALRKLRALPPLVTSWEVEELKREIALAQEGKRFLLQGGDCAETLSDCTSEIIANKLKILLQMSLVLIHGAARPVIRVGRFAGQYAKPRSSATEARGDVTLPSYFGDLVNGPEFTAASRRADPEALLRGYSHAAMTLNFIRSLCAAGFADLHHPEYWDLGFMSRDGLPADVRAQYEGMTTRLSAALRFMEALGERTVDELTGVSFYTSHEGLNLHYEAAQTRRVPRREGHYDLTTHLPWVGERTRSLDGAHIDFFGGIENAVGVKLGPKASVEEAVELCRALNRRNEPGKLVLITRMGAGAVAERLPLLVEGVHRAGCRVLWVTDPMHGNTVSLPSGVKTRRFEDILSEIEQSFDVHARVGTHLGGVHFELTGDNVTECIGGGLKEEDLDRNYATLCDPRLNYPQALEMAFRVAQRMPVHTNHSLSFPPPRADLGGDPT
jgi:3-deoxy-7-phosphoheptulonate synthase